MVLTSGTPCNTPVINDGLTTKINKMKQLFTILCALTLTSLSAECPDLKITHASLVKLQPNAIQYALNIANIGNQPAHLDGATPSESDNVIIHSYLSKDQVIDLWDQKIQPIILGLTSLEVINAGEVFSIVNRDSIPTQGYKYLLVKIDATNVLNECSEENNILILELSTAPLSLEAPIVEGPKGTSVEIPIYANNFYNILGFQFSISFSKPSIFRIDSIGNLGLNDMVKNDIRIKDLNTLGVIWFSSQPEGLTFNGKKRLFTIFATLTGDHNECTDIRFDNSFLPIEFISTSPLSEPVDVIKLDGRLCIQNLLECAGRVTLSNQTPIPGVKIKANNKEGIRTAITDFNGKYLLKDLNPGSQYTISADKTDSYLNGLSIMDILLIKKHILEIQLLPTPYEIISADVNGDLTLSVQDIILIRNLILGVIPHFGKTPVWQFIPKTYKFKNPKNPLLEDYPVSYNLNLLNSNQVGLDFIGIKTGDVSLDWMEGKANALESRAADYFTLTIKEEKLEANREYVIPVYTRQFNRIAGFQFSLKLDPSITLIKMTAPSLPDFEEYNYRKSQNQLNVLWYDTRTDIGRFIPDTGTLFLVHIKTSLPIESKQIFNMDSKLIRPEGVHALNRYYTIKMESLNIQTPNKSRSDAFKVHLFPNPVTELLNIRFYSHETGLANIRVIDLIGRTIIQVAHNMSPGEQNLQLNTRNWPEGQYAVQIATKHQFKTQSVVCHH